MDTNEPPGSTSVTSLNGHPSAANGNGYVFEHATQSILWAMGVNFVIAVIKFLGWFISHSPSMLSEALHSLGDSINSVALLIGIRLSTREPDKTHPYGYGLEASVWAIFACVLLLVFGSVAIFEGYHRLIGGIEEEIHFIPGFEWIDPFSFTAGILIVSILLEIVAVQRASKAVLEEFDIEARGFSAIFKAFAHIKDVKGPTTRFVFYEDNVALFGATLALIAITLSNYAVQWGLLPPGLAHWPDALASIVIGMVLAAMAIYLFTHNRSILTGTSAGSRVEQKIRQITNNIHGISEVTELKTIDHGAGGLTIHMTVEVEPDTPVKDVDDLTEHVKDKIQGRVPNVNNMTVEVLADETDEEWEQKFYDLIDLGIHEDVLKPREEVMLKNLYDFTHATIEDVMIPRTDVVSLDIETLLTDAINTIIESGHSRFPLYEEKIDNIVGMIHTRDVFEKIANKNFDGTLRDVMRKIDIYPENKPVSDLLEDLKRKKTQIVAVADEHGGFAGIVTIEDLLEEIVGEIWDEHDEDDDYTLDLVKPNRIRVSGKYEIEDINKTYDLNIPEDAFNTIGGFVFGEIGKEPKVGDLVNFEDLTITVVEADGPRIKMLTIDSPVAFEVKVDNGNGNNGDEATDDSDTVNTELTG